MLLNILSQWSVEKQQCKNKKNNLIIVIIDIPMQSSVSS